MYKVLLVDDEQIERMALARRIDKYYGDRVSISQAADGRDALRVFQQEQSEIIIMDISMPEMNGVMAARQIREWSSSCSIIFLSAYDDFNYTRNAIKVQALDYLLKPCDLEDLLAVMDVALHRCDKYAILREKDNNAAQLDEQKMQKSSQLKKEAEYLTGSENQIEESPIRGNSGENELVVAERMKCFVQEHYMEEISMQEAARVMGYSDAYFSKLFKQYFNQNFTAYLTEYRIREAKRLLENTNESIKDISQMVGYFDSNYFAKIFKRIEGIIPSKYREKIES